MLYWKFGLHYCISLIFLPFGYFKKVGFVVFDFFLYEVENKYGVYTIGNGQ
jgi:hypothetical protein